MCYISPCSSPHGESDFAGPIPPLPPRVQSQLEFLELSAGVPVVDPVVPVGDGMMGMDVDHLTMTVAPQLVSALGDQWDYVVDWSLSKSFTTTPPESVVITTSPYRLSIPVGFINLLLVHLVRFLNKDLFRSPHPHQFTTTSCRFSVGVLVKSLIAAGVNLVTAVSWGYKIPIMEMCERLSSYSKQLGDAVGVLAVTVDLSHSVSLLEVDGKSEDVVLFSLQTVDGEGTVLQDSVEISEDGDCYGEFLCKYKGKWGDVKFEVHPGLLLLGGDVLRWGGFVVNPVDSVVEKVTVYQRTHHWMLGQTSKFVGGTKVPKTLGGVKGQVDDLQVVAQMLARTGLNGRSAGHRIEARVSLAIPAHSTVDQVAEILVSALVDEDGVHLLQSVDSLQQWLNGHNRRSGEANKQFNIATSSVPVVNIVKAVEALLEEWDSEYSHVTVSSRRKCGSGAFESAPFILQCLASVLGFSPPGWTSAVRRRLRMHKECRDVWQRVHAAVLGFPATVEEDHGGDYTGLFDGDRHDVPSDPDDPPPPPPQATEIAGGDLGAFIEEHRELVEAVVESGVLELWGNPLLYSVKGRNGGVITRGCWTVEEVLAEILLRFPVLLEAEVVPEMVQKYVLQRPAIVGESPTLSDQEMEDVGILLVKEDIWVQSPLGDGKKNTVDRRMRGVRCWQIRMKNGTKSKKGIITKREAAILLVKLAQQKGVAVWDLLKEPEGAAAEDSEGSR